MRGKKDLVANVCAATGTTWLLERAPRKPLLMILNYHRIGDPQATQYDSGTFSATAEELDWQIGYLKRHYRMTTLAEVLDLLDGTDKLAEPRALITFDDGYLDNYQLAFPVLRRHGVQGIFFVPTAFAGTNRIPWWDSIAYIARRARRPQFQLTYPHAETYDIQAEGVGRTIMRILNLYKLPEMRDNERFLAELERACDSSRPNGEDRCFLNWDEAREMIAGGMAFGSHTHTHEILSKLAPSRQVEELQISREILEAELKQTVDTLAYPVGARDTFSPDTVEALRKANYRASFTFYGGFNRQSTMTPFDIKRCGMERHTQSRVRLQAAVGSLTGSVWF